MKRFAGVVFAVVFASSYALGGTVSFDPSKHSVEAGTQVDFELTISDSGSLDSFQTVAIVVGSNDGLVLTEFVWAEITPFPNIVYPVSASPKYMSGVVFGFGNFFTGYTAPLTIGTLSVDTNDLPIGTYEVVISSDNDGGQSGLAEGTLTEPLFGIGTINIIPEPATISLLGLAALCVTRWRRPGTVFHE